MSKYEIAIGSRYNRLTVIDELPRINRYRRRWLCRCECGKETEVDHYNIGGGEVKSCGCMRDEVSSARAIDMAIHNMSRTPEHIAWCAMIARCTNPKLDSWKNYGGRGISVSDEFFGSFLAFYEHIGPRPTPSHSLDRIDNSKGYCRGNVRWATKAQQSRNSRQAKLDMGVAGEIRRASRVERTSALARRFGVSQGLVSQIKTGVIWKEGQE